MIATTPRSPRFLSRHRLLLPSGLFVLLFLALVPPSLSQAQTDYDESVQHIKTQSALIELARNQLADDDLVGMAETVERLRQVSPNHRSLVLFGHALRHFNAPVNKSNPLLGMLPPEEAEEEETEDAQLPSTPETPEATPSPAPTPDPTPSPEATPEPLPFATAPLLADTPPPPRSGAGGVMARLQQGDLTAWGVLLLLAVALVWFVGRAFRGGPQPITPEPEEERSATPPEIREKVHLFDDVDLDARMPRSIAGDDGPSSVPELWADDDSGAAPVLPIEGEESESSRPEAGPRALTDRGIEIIEENKDDTGPISLDGSAAEPDQIEEDSEPVYVFDDPQSAPEASPRRIVEDDVELEDISPQQIVAAMAEDESPRNRDEESLSPIVGTTSVPEFDFSGVLDIQAPEQEKPEEIPEKQAPVPEIEPPNVTNIEVIEEDEEDEEPPAPSPDESAPHMTVDAQAMPNGDTIFHSDEDTVVHLEGQAEDTYFHSDEETAVPDTRDGDEEAEGAPSQATKREPDGVSPFHSMDDTVVSDLEASDDDT